MPSRCKRPALIAGAVCAVMLGAGLIAFPAYSADSMYGAHVPAARAHLHAVNDSNTAQAVLAGGCFWGMEEVFSHVKGVTDAVSGYAGGDKAHANYRDVSIGRYRNAEAVRISYDPSQISYAALLRIYFSAAHDPTQVNRQGPDAGPQYRSEVFAADADQARVARSYIKQLDAAHVFDDSIATRVSVGDKFFPAASYHQNYAAHHPDSYYLKTVDAPKVEALNKRFPKRYTRRFIEGGRLAAADRN